MSTMNQTINVDDLVSWEHIEAIGPLNFKAVAPIYFCTYQGLNHVKKDPLRFFDFWPKLGHYWPFRDLNIV